MLDAPVCCPVVLHKRCSTTTLHFQNSSHKRIHRTSTRELQITVCLLLLDPPLLDAGRNPQKPCPERAREDQPTNLIFHDRSADVNWNNNVGGSADLAREAFALSESCPDSSSMLFSTLQRTREFARSRERDTGFADFFVHPERRLVAFRQNRFRSERERILSSVFVFWPIEEGKETRRGSERVRSLSERGTESATPECAKLCCSSLKRIQCKGAPVSPCLCCGRVGGWPSYAQSLALTRAPSRCILLCCRWFMLGERKRENENPRKGMRESECGRLHPKVGGNLRWKL